MKYPSDCTFVYGPPGCGKTACAEIFKMYFEHEEIIDNWSPDDNRQIPNNSLVLTNINLLTLPELCAVLEDNNINLVISYEDALYMSENS